jgi:16S rRNA (uracil1498-N3)-methyltransferase
MIVLLDAGSPATGEAAKLAEGEEHHLRVRRARDGDRVELRDGAGLVGTGQLMRAGRGWTVDVHASHVVARPLGLTLAVGAGDRERVEWLVEKATELGVTWIALLETERTAAVATRVRASQVGKLRRHAFEAVKQCGAAWAPRIDDPQPLTTFVARPIDGQRWLADPAGRMLAAAGTDPITALIGPEGGLTEPERAAVLAADYRPVRLGAHMLRFETAAVAIAAVVAASRPPVPGGAHG